MSELFKPFSSFEINIDKISLKDNLVSTKINNGVLRSFDIDLKHSQASLSQFARDPINILTSHSSIGSSLYGFLVELRVIEIIFLCSDLFRSMTVLAHKSKWNTGLFPREKTSAYYVKLSTIFLDVQNYLKANLIKLSHAEFYKEGNMHLLLLKRSQVAMRATNGLFQINTVYSYQEIKNLVRRAFEFAIYSQRLSFKCFEMPFVRGTLDEHVLLKKQQEESVRVVLDFQRVQNYSSSNQRTPVQPGRGMRDRSLHSDALRSLNPRQINMSANLSVKHIAVGTTSELNTELTYLEHHRSAMDKFKISHKWKN